MTAEYQKPPFTSPEGQENFEHSLLKKNIGKLYTKEMRQRGELGAEMEKRYGFFYDSAFSDDKDGTSDQMVVAIRDEWVKRVREKTHFFDFVDSLGIEIFKEDLTEQGGFPGVDVTFEDRDLLQSETLDNTRLLGTVHKDEGAKIKLLKGPLRAQLLIFLNEGHVDLSMDIMIHELVHIKHRRDIDNLDKRGNEENVLDEAILTEAGAFATGIFSRTNNIGLTGFANALSRESGFYRFDKDLVISALTSVALFYSLGKTGAEISKYIAQAVNQGGGSGDAIARFEEIANRETKIQNLDDEDKQALYDILRLHAGNQATEARLELMKTIEDMLDMEKLKEKKLNNITKRIVVPSYYIGGSRFPSSEFEQKIVVIGDKEFPYEFDKKRSCIIFGYYPTKDGRVDYGVGRFESSGPIGPKQEVNINWANTLEEKKFLLDALAKHAPKVTFEDKIDVIKYLVTNSEDEKSNIKMDILHSLCGKKEIKVFFERSTRIREDAELFDEFFTFMKFMLVYEKTNGELVGEIKQSFDSRINLIPERSRNFRNFISSLKAVFEMYNLKDSDLPSDLIEHINNAEKLATKVEKLYEEREKRNKANKKLNENETKNPD